MLIADGQQLSLFWTTLQPSASMSTRSTGAPDGAGFGGSALCQRPPRQPLLALLVPTTRARRMRSSRSTYHSRPAPVKIRAAMEDSSLQRQYFHGSQEVSQGRWQSG